MKTKVPNWPENGIHAPRLLSNKNTKPRQDIHTMAHPGPFQSEIRPKRIPPGIPVGNSHPRSSEYLVASAAACGCTGLSPGF
mmetsp:Transcript_42421/g.83642  ORF Transcript_42421/g.83642 Transcript_42421/m.83642 type:complete len:82 (+) Transcript_42421:667-912(+)